MVTRHNVVGYGGSVHHVACGHVHLGLVLRDVLTAESIYTSDENSEGAQRRLHEYTEYVRGYTVACWPGLARHTRPPSACAKPHKSRISTASSSLKSNPCHRPSASRSVSIHLRIDAVLLIPSPVRGALKHRHHARSYACYGDKLARRPRR